MGGWMDGWVGEWMDGWVNGWMEARGGLRITFSKSKILNFKYLSSHRPFFGLDNTYFLFSMNLFDLAILVDSLGQCTRRDKSF